MRATPFRTIKAAPGDRRRAVASGRRDGARLAVRIVLLSVCVAMAVVAALTDHRWIARHMLPDLIVPLRYRVLMIDVERVLLVILGGVLAFVLVPRIDGAIHRGQGRQLAQRAAWIALALVLAALGSEAAMRWVTWRHDQPWRIDREPLRRANARYGWENVPGRAVVDTFYSPAIHYAVDAGGHRVSALAQPIDYRRPSILFLGESIMFGAGLNWADTIPGRVQSATGLQSANLAVNGFATDQAHLRLREEIARFAQPVAVVAIFGPALMERNIRHNKPWLDADLGWHPAESEWRLHHLFRFLVPLHKTATIRTATAAARSVLCADQAIARAHGARLIVLVPTFLPEAPGEAALRRAVLDGADLTVVQVALDPSWHVASDYHPDARADRLMAAAIVKRLKATSQSLRGRPG